MAFNRNGTFKTTSDHIKDMGRSLQDARDALPDPLDDKLADSIINSLQGVMLDLQDFLGTFRQAVK